MEQKQLACSSHLCGEVEIIRWKETGMRDSGEGGFDQRCVCMSVCVLECVFFPEGLSEKLVPS